MDSQQKKFLTAVVLMIKNSVWESVRTFNEEQNEVFQVYKLLCSRGRIHPLIRKLLSGGKEMTTEKSLLIEAS